MEGFKVENDVISKNSQNRLYDIVTARDFTWHIMKDSAYASGINTPDFWNMIGTIGYSRTIFAGGEIYEKEIMPWCLHVLDSTLDKAGIQMDELHRIQINLLYRNTDPLYKEGMWTTAHIDEDKDHTVLLYYVNDSDGDTFLFNEKRNEEFSEFTELVRVTPKAGSALLFNGQHFHSASNPINSIKRLAINFNFTEKDKNGKVTK